MQRHFSAKAQIHNLLKAVSEASCIVEYWDGDQVAYGNGSPDFTLQLKNPEAVKKVLASLLVELPEAYVNGDIAIEGDLQSLLRLCYTLDPKRLRFSVSQKMALALNAIRQRNSLSGAGRNVARHYDLGNDFFRLWLDEQMVYSCAYFEKPDDDLETAQIQKLEHLCRKMQISPGQQLLDIGCGWGALALHAARLHGARVIGITRSEEQRSLCEAKIKQAGLETRVEVRLQDYRQLVDAIFDRVVSVGMMEHVGKAYLPDYIAMIARCLRPGGLGVLQWISKNEPGELTPWITMRIFPGMYLPTLAEIATALATRGLRLLDVENLRPHYALTLDAWTSRFETERDLVEGMYGAPFVRMWRMYLNAASVAFKFGDLDLWQATFTNGLGRECSLTRRNLYESRHSGLAH